MRRGLPAAAILASLILAGPAQAVDFDVTRTDDPVPGACLANDCSLREAVRAANQAATDDIIRLPAGNHSLMIPGDDAAAAMGDLDVTDNLAIGGQGPSLTAVNAGALDRAFEVIGSGTNFTLVGVTVTGGRLTGDPPVDAGAGVRAGPNTGLLELADVTFSDNAVDPGGASTASGGAVYHEGAELRIGRSSFEENRAIGDADGSGGAVAAVAANAEITITGSRFDDNFAIGSGGAGTGGAVLLSGADQTTRMFDVDFRRNGALADLANAAHGGAVASQGADASLEITGGRFAANQVGGPEGDGNGGAVDVVGSGASLTIADSVFSANAAGGNNHTSAGGAVAVAGSPSSLASSRTIYSANRAGGGGGSGSGTGGAVSVAGTGGSVTLTRDTLESNRAGGDEAIGTGGGLSVTGDNRTVTVDRTEIDSNRAGGGGGTGSGGGAAVAGLQGTVSIRRSTLSRNIAGGGGGQGFGGGTHLTGTGLWTLVNTTIAHNSLPAGAGVLGVGAGAFLNGAATTNALNVTVARNRINPSGSAIGGGFARANGTVTVRNSIVSGNTPNNCAPGGIVSAGRNIEQGTTCGFTAATDRNADPRLDSLEENGGDTPTMAIFASSPAFDRGRNCPAVDQRGVLRPVGPFCDIGAYETGPRILTRAASNVRFNRAQLNGTVTPNFRRTTTRFEFGRTTSYGRSVAGPTLNSGAPATGFSRIARNLRPNTTYHYRAVASSFDRTTYGADRTFRTPKDPFPGLRLSKQTVDVQGDVARVRATCPEVTAGACRGNLVLRSGDAIIARAEFEDLDPGATRRIGAKLTDTGRARIADGTVVTRATATARNGAGTKRVTSAQVTLTR